MFLLYTVMALAASVSLAAPTSKPSTSPSPRLLRRQVPFPFNPLTIGLGAGGVHLNHKNTNNIQTVQAQIQATQTRLNMLQAQEQALQGGGGPRLARRQVGTILGAVGIHDSHKNRKMIQDMQQQCDAMRSQTDGLLQAEGLAPQLQRRQLGIILGPVAIHKAHTDEKMLDQVQAELNGINMDLGRVQAAQQTRMSQRSFGGFQNVNVVTASFGGPQPGYNGDVDAAGQTNYGAPPAYGGAGALPSSQGYGGNGALPSNQGYGSNNGALPSNQGYGSNNGALPSSQGYGAPPAYGGGGALPSNQGYGAPQRAY